MSELTVWDILENARINLEVNLPKFVPGIKQNPIYLMGIEQLNSGLKKMEEEAFIEEIKEA